jgi:hypothetical protein
MALLTGLGLERLMLLSAGSRLRALPGFFLALALIFELLVWQHSQRMMDSRFRAPVRDLQRAAQAACLEGQRRGLPVLSETHPTLGAQFRFLSGQDVPLPDAKAASVVAFVSWEYLPALRGHFGPMATFQEDGGSGPSFVAVLDGPLAREALNAELQFRPLLTKETQYTVESMDQTLDWLRQDHGAGPWARSVFIDYLVHCGLYLGRMQRAWISDALHEHLYSARPLMVLAESQEGTEPEAALLTLRQARSLDPHNAQLWDDEERILKRLGRPQELAALAKEKKPLADKLQLFVP